MASSDDRLTNRCAICDLNWPYHVAFNTCPQCDEPCKPLRLNHPTSIDDPIMTYEEALRYCRENGLEHVPAAHRAKHIPVKPHLETEIRKLHADLEAWATAAPVWMRRR